MNQRVLGFLLAWNMISNDIRKVDGQNASCLNTAPIAWCYHFLSMIILDLDGASKESGGLFNSYP